MWVSKTTIPTWQCLTLRAKLNHQPRGAVRADGREPGGPSQGLAPLGSGATDQAGVGAVPGAGTVAARVLRLDLARVLATGTVWIFDRARGAQTLGHG